MNKKIVAIIGLGLLMIGCGEYNLFLKEALKSGKNHNDPQKICGKMLDKQTLGAFSWDDPEVFYYITIQTDLQKHAVSTNDEKIWLTPDSTYICLERGDGKRFYQLVPEELIKK